MNEINIEGRKIGPHHPPFIIAEMSGNHNQSLERAFNIIEEAAKAGAHALKIQTYTADTMTLNMNTKDFKIEDENSLWSGRTLYTLYQQAYTPWEWHKPIFDKCRELGMIPLSTPFDESSVDFWRTWVCLYIKSLHLKIPISLLSKGSSLLVSLLSFQPEWLQ